MTSSLIYSPQLLPHTLMLSRYQVPPPITTPTSGPLPIPQGKHLSFEYFKMANPDYVYRLADTMMGYTSSEVSILVLKVGILVVRLVY